MGNKYTSKFPKILIDKKGNSPNESLQKKITIEEYYDLMHHTHNISTLIIDEDGTTYQEVQDTINKLNGEITNLRNTVQELQKSNNELKEIVQNLTGEITNTPAVSDWDVEKPGNQDIDGNDLGTIMGYNLSEIN